MHRDLDLQRAFAIGIGVLFVALRLAACGQPSVPAPDAPLPSPTASDDVIVFAAASLTESFTEIGRAFEAAHPGVTVIFNFAGSQQLAQQLGQDAPADVFASANVAQMQVAIDADRVDSGAQQTFARNRLVVITPADNPGAITTLNDLARPGLKIVLAAKDAPVGAYALAYLEKASQAAEFGEGYQSNVLGNVVSYEETVKAALAKVALGEADAGIVYASDVTPDQAAQVQTIAIPDDLNTIAVYPIAPVSNSNRAQLARAFIDYALSADGQAVLEKYGFISALQ